MKYFSYLVYIIFWESLCWIGGGYVVFILNHSGLWFVPIFFLACSAYKPLQWIHGIPKEEP